MAVKLPLMQEVEQFRREALSLAQAVGQLTPEQWSLPTQFKSWTPWDIVAHLAIADTWAVATLQSRENFARQSADVVAALAQGVRLTDLTRRAFGNIAGSELVEVWLAQVADVCARLATIDPASRVAWFGPDMPARTLAVARYMEVWAHGQAIYDSIGLPRVFDDGIESIALLGVKTFSFAYRNRGLAVPPKAPFIRLVSPTGATWQWNEPSTTDFVEGPAGEFCQVVTQCRNVADTALRAVGTVANHWMSIAQCFAGSPETPPAPGARSAAVSSSGRR